MLKFKNVVIAAAVVCLLSLAAHAATVVCPVEVDTYILHGHGINGGYPDRTAAKSWNWVGAEALFRFGLSEIESIPAVQYRIVSGEFSAYTGQCDETAMMCQPMAPAGTTQRAQVLALRTWGDNHPYYDEDDPPDWFPYWTEAGGYANGYIDGTVEGQGYPPNPPNIYDPGDVGGHDTYHYQQHGLNPGDPTATFIHSGGPGVPENWGGNLGQLNPDGWAEVELKEFVRRWVLPEEDEGYIANNGIRIHDLGGWSGSPDPAFPDDYAWGWCFCSKDYMTAEPGMYDPNFHLLPADDYLPGLTVTIAASGDADADADVDQQDFYALGANWTGHAPGSGKIWPEGDFDGDGDVDQLDFYALGANWTGTGGGTPQSTPEPRTIILLCAGGVALMLHRWGVRRMRQGNRESGLTRQFTSLHSLKRKENVMRGILILLAVVSLAVSPASAATTITWDVDVADNGDGSSRYLFKAMTDDRAIVGFTARFHCSEIIAQLLGDPTPGQTGGPVQIDKFADAAMANIFDPGYDWNKDSFVWSAFDFVPAAWAEGDNFYGSSGSTPGNSGFAGSSPPWDEDQGKGSFVELVQLVAPSGLDFQTAIGEGDFGYRGNLGLWEGPGIPVVETDAPFGIPEPGTIALLGSGGFALLWLAFRRRKRQRIT